jgi:cyclopropane fatty-acyl-phospholipid synthase-like methyltransferase
MNAEAYCEGYTASHAATSLAGVARDMAAQIATLPAFRECRTMLDLGGGPAVNAMALVQANTHLHATVFDRPAIARMARDYIRSYGFSDRMDARGGDYLRDPLGDGYDLITITDSLYYAGEQVDLLLRKCREALRPGGMIVGIHAVLTHERTRPSHSVLGMLTEAMTDQGDLPDQGFLEQALVRCGFDRIISRMVLIGDSMMEMNVGHLKAAGPQGIETGNKKKRGMK